MTDPHSTRTAMTAVVFVLTLSAGLIGRAGLKALYAAAAVGVLFRFALNKIGNDDTELRVFGAACLAVGTANVIAVAMRRSENADPTDPEDGSWSPFGGSNDDDD